jgi:hypothetical protein
MGLLGNLPDINKLSAMFDEDFDALSQRLDTMIDLLRQLVAAQQPKPS